MSTYSCILCKLLAFCAHFTIYNIYISSSFNYSCISGDLHYPIYIEFHLVYFIMFFVKLMWGTCTYFVSYMHSMHDWHTLPLRLWVYITINTYVVLLIVVCNEFNFSMYSNSIYKKYICLHVSYCYTYSLWLLFTSIGTSSSLISERSWKPCHRALTKSLNLLLPLLSTLLTTVQYRGWVGKEVQREKTCSYLWD